jgi:hypothetical protein
MRHYKKSTGAVTAIAVAVIATTTVSAFCGPGGRWSPSKSILPARPTISLHQSEARTSSLPLFSSSSSSSSSASTTTTTAQPTLPETSPLPRHTFAGQVEHGMIEHFGADAVARVVQSWRFLERDYVHKAFIGPGVPENSNNHQLSHSYIPGLTVRPFWDPSEWSWCSRLQRQYPAILQEFQSVTSNREELQTKGNNIWAGALTEDASSYGVGWKTLVLMDRGIWDPVNVNLFPVTAQAVHDSGVPAVEVFFASMEPHSNIQLHSDFTNFVLTSHLPLIVPYSGSNQCRLSIGDETRQWLNGQVMIFDTSMMHDAVNQSDQTRYILMLRLWHPDLTPVERQALQFIYDALLLPELVSDDPFLRQQAERQVEEWHAFPLKSRPVAGFDTSSQTKNSKNKKNKKSASPRSGPAKGFGAE